MAKGVLASILEGPHRWGHVTIGPGTLWRKTCLDCQAYVELDAPPPDSVAGKYVTGDGIELHGPYVPGCDGPPRETAPA